MHSLAFDHQLGIFLLNWYLWVSAQLIFVRLNDSFKHSKPTDRYGSPCSITFCEYPCRLTDSSKHPRLANRFFLLLSDIWNYPWSTSIMTQTIALGLLVKPKFVSILGLITIMSMNTDDIGFTCSIPSFRYILSVVSHKTSWPTDSYEWARTLWSSKSIRSFESCA